MGHWLCVSEALTPLGWPLFINKYTEAWWLLQGHMAQLIPLQACARAAGCGPSPGVQGDAQDFKAPKVAIDPDTNVPS